MAYKSIKLILDWLCALVFLLVSSWLFMLIYVFILLTGAKPLFTQLRTGRNNKIFLIYKFRTLHKERPTTLGAFLRKSSLDELPQLINVLKGEMSFVGPRPLLPEYMPLYSLSQRKRHDVKPGITGWAQVKGRNNLSWEQQFDLDIWYVENRSFWLDLRILTLTAIHLFKAQKSEVQMRERFNGRENT